VDLFVKIIWGLDPQALAEECQDRQPAASSPEGTGGAA
jgi:hypothetical protein